MKNKITIALGLVMCATSALAAQNQMRHQQRQENKRIPQARKN